MSKLSDLRKKLRDLGAQYIEVEKELSEYETSHFRVCIFGSARIRPEDPTYQMVRQLACTIGMLGIDIVTGGGPGLMEAANQGLKESAVKDVRSIGLPIQLPGNREDANQHLDIKSEHTRFSLRLDEFMRLSQAVIVAPGGIGTLLELAYVWQLIQVGLIEPRPVVLLGREFWGGLVQWMRDQQLRREFIDPGDLDFVHFADTEAEVLDKIKPELEKFKQKRLAIGDEPRAEELQTMLHQVEKVKETLSDEKLPGTKT